MASEKIKANKSLLIKSDLHNQVPRKSNSILEEKNVKNYERAEGTSTPTQRPTNLNDLFHEENLIHDETAATFDLRDISDNEEIWVFDVPKTINPKNMKGQTVKLGDTTDFQLGNDLYETNSITRNNNHPLTFVFNTGSQKQPYKAANVIPAGYIQVRKKLTKTLNVKLKSPKKESVPFPKNLKLRHPLFGCDYDKKIILVNKLIHGISKS